MRTKLIHYYLPAYPACALLVAWLVVNLIREEVALRRWPLGRLGLGVLNSIGIGSVVALVAASCVVQAPVRWPCLVLAVVLAAGTLAAALRLYRGATDRGVACLIATWAVMGLLIGSWLLPALEPYRMARRVGERLATLSAQLGLEPVLLTFQEPSTVYAFGRPVPTIKVWEDLYEQLRRHGEVIAPLMQHELKEFYSRPWLHVEPGEVMTGLNLSKGQTQSLTFTRIRPVGDWARAKQSPIEDPPPRVAKRCPPGRSDEANAVPRVRDPVPHPSINPNYQRAMRAFVGYCPVALSHSTGPDRPKLRTLPGPGGPFPVRSWKYLMVFSTDWRYCAGRPGPPPC